MLLATTGWVLAQSAALLPNARTQFFDRNGNPVVGGKVFTYVPNTTVPKTTWQDSAEATPNSNPVLLDSAGEAFIFGQGSYTETLVDASNALLWTGFTTAPGTSVPTGGSAQDTAPVGTVVPFSGFTVPTNWLLAAGQAVNRTTFSQLLSTITIQTTVGVCSGTQISGFTSTAQMSVGQSIEASCAPSNTTITSIVNTSTVAVSNSVTGASNVTAVVFPWGNGDGVTTFNVPDLRGRTFAGADSMNGSAASRLTSGNYGASAAAPGVSGGQQAKSLVQANLPNVSFTNSGITVGNGTLGVTSTAHASTTASTNSPTSNYWASGSGITGAGVSTNSIYETTTNTTMNAGVITNALTGIVAVTAQGTAASGGSGTALTTIQPTITVNYIIKAQAASSGLGGVISVGGMFGDLVCGAGLTCTAQTISSTLGSLEQSVVDKGTVAGTVTFNVTDGLKQKMTVGGAVTVSFANFLATGLYSEMEIQVVNGGTNVTWPTVQWLLGDGTDSTTFTDMGVALQASGTNWVIIWSTDGGATIFGRAG